ncbi:MAG: hypothetical protein S4CHLAM20_13110 [Chlamydiia bacterium]|nr:hypothetical protein [Chlamydiia bacterium]
MSAISILLQNPLALVAYILIICAILSPWFFPKYYIFAPVYVISYSLAYLAGIVTYASLIPILIILICFWALKFNPKRFIHLFASMIVAILGLCIMTHMLRGFNNLQIYKAITIGSSSVPLNIYLNFDKATLAVLLLGLYIPLLKTFDQWKQMLFITLPLAAFTIFILIGYAKFAHLIAFDFKIPSITLMWLLVNFFFVTIPEETFFRGFLQSEIIKNLPNKAAPVLSILIVSLLFSAIHLLFIADFYYIIATFIASILYGTIYQLTKSIESSIITHFLVNTIHFFFFTYPLI